MKMSIRLAALFCLVFCLSDCNKSEKTSADQSYKVTTDKLIKTPDGDFVVHPTADGLSKIILTNSQWNTLVGKENSYANLVARFGNGNSSSAVADDPALPTEPGFGINICLIIANKEKKRCVSGVGFKCGFIKCVATKPMGSTVPDDGIHTDRIYNANISIDPDGNQIVEFTEPVNWEWLENN